MLSCRLHDITGIHKAALQRECLIECVLEKYIVVTFIPFKVNKDIS